MLLWTVAIIFFEAILEVVQVETKASRRFSRL